MGDPSLRPIVTVVLLSLASACATSKPAATSEAAPVPAAPLWETRVVAFATVDPPEARPWRSEPRLSGQFHSKDFPDDVQVLFEATQDGVRHVESMWVTVLGHDDRTDRYLGRLLNTPDFVRTVQDADNVVFHLGTPGQYTGIRGLPERSIWLVADDDGRGYAAQAWPRQRTQFVDALVRGIRAYRLGNFGHNPPGIEQCITELRPALSPEPPTVDQHDLQVGHFVLARCLAEKYESVEALGHFDRAVALDRRDPHAQMGVISELTVLVHTDKDGSRREAWKARLIQEITRMERDFPEEKQSLLLLNILRDPSHTDRQLTPAELEEGKQIGFGTIRDKYR